VFLPRCERPSLTPIQNNRQNYSSVHLNLYILGRIENILDLFYVGVCGGKICTRTGFSASTLCAFPVSIIPPKLHTHSFIYHQRCIMFFSQHFSFPCQYHSTNAPYSFIHLPPTLYNVFLPAIQFPLSVSFHQCSILIHPSTTHAV